MHFNINKKKFLIVILISLALMLAYYLKQGEKENIVSQKTEGPKKLEDLTINQLSDEKTSNQSSQEKIEKAFDSSSEAFEKCFKKEWPKEGVLAVFKIIERYRDFSNPTLIEENYELEKTNGEKLVVQYLPAEEKSEQVRVFKIDPNDQLPDRVNEYPQSSDATLPKLAGALTLGQIKKKTKTTNQTSYDGTQLSVDKENDKVTRFHVVAREFDFECKNEKCICLMK